MRKATAVETLAALAIDNLIASDPEAAHATADQILLKLVHPDVAAAYRRLAEDRAPWWGAA